MKIQLGETGWSNEAKRNPIRVGKDGAMTFSIDVERRERDKRVTITLTHDEAKALMLNILSRLLP